LPPTDDPIPPYDHGVAEFAAKFETLSPDALWAHVRDLIPARPGAIALDIGAGSGRDAAWLASLGMTAVAAEPADQRLRLGRLLHPELRWLEDRLPDLTFVNRLGLSFDIVLLSAVWMHLRPTDRPRAFRKMATLLKPGGLLLMTLRHGPAEPGRTLHPVSLGEVEALARDHGLTVVRVVDNPDRLGRPEVSWTTVCLRLPDDGTMGLPLIRGVILNDSKSSTYKLGLLRAVARIADSAPSLAVPSTTEADQVSVPLGLVALNWIRAYLPLVAAGLPQMPGNAGPDGLGFAKAGFRALMALGVTARDLRIGAIFTAERARAVMSALREARATIVDMPVRHTTLPNATARVFEPHSLTVRAPAAFTLDADLLAAFGDLSVPGPIWRTMLRLGAWIEPVLIGEWARLIKDYALTMGRVLAPGEVEARLMWQEPARDTSLARMVAGRLSAGGAPIKCVWTGARLSIDTLDIDHTLPWSAWPCGDLWNLAPALRRVNQHEKRDRLPSASALAGARQPILAWWEEAWNADPALAARFGVEARAALPIDGAITPDAVFAGMERRRLRLQQDQQPPEWAGVRGVYHRPIRAKKSFSVPCMGKGGGEAVARAMAAANRSSKNWLPRSSN
jgi:SAM-dependent methyltransferase